MAGGYAICPYCKATVQPQTGADGRKVCPACRNTGHAQVAPTVPAPSFATGSTTATAPKPNAPGALASLICGIVGIVTGFLGLVLGIIAIALAGSARKAMAREPGKYGGEGLATAGRICGIIAIVVSVLAIVLAAVVFVLVSNLAGSFDVPEVTFTPDNVTDTITVDTAEDGLHWDEFDLEGDAVCDLPSGTVDAGDVIQCSSPGTVRIRHLPSDEVVFATTLS